MKRWLSLLTIGILVIGFAVSLSLLFQTYARLDDANAEITDLKVAVSDLKSDLSVTCPPKTIPVSC